MANDETRWCFFIVEDREFDTPAGILPCIVFEGQDGYVPFFGNPENGPYPRYWGGTWDEARAMAERFNADLGLTPQDVARIVTSSMFSGPRLN